MKYSMLHEQIYSQKPQRFGAYWEKFFRKGTAGIGLIHLSGRVFTVVVVFQARLPNFIATMMRGLCESSKKTENESVRENRNAKTLFV